MSIRRASSISGIGFEWFVFLGLVMGCGSSTMKASGAGGSVGGTLATGGAATTGTGGAAVTATGGSAVVTGTGGAASGTGGSSSAATGGSTAVGSSAVDCTPPVTTYCTGTVPPAALISDFSIAAGATTPAAFGTWGQSIYGGPYAYPGSAPACETGAVSAYPLTQTVTGGNWNVQGTVGTYSGMGLWWNCNTGTTAAASYAGACTVDASAYTGISFTISGTIGPVSKGTGTVGLSMSV